jgi:hypothetical protein
MKLPVLVESFLRGPAIVLAILGAIVLACVGANWMFDRGYFLPFMYGAMGIILLALIGTSWGEQYRKVVRNRTPKATGAVRRKKREYV